MEVAPGGKPEIVLPQLGAISGFPQGQYEHGRCLQLHHHIDPVFFKQGANLGGQEPHRETADVVPGASTFLLDGERLEQGQHVLLVKLGNFGCKLRRAELGRQHDNGLHLHLHQSQVLGRGGILVGHIGIHALHRENVGLDRPPGAGRLAYAKHDHGGHQNQPQFPRDHAVNHSHSSGESPPQRFIHPPVQAKRPLYHE